MADKKTCSCGHCKWFPGAEEWALFSGNSVWDDVHACPSCGDHLLPGGDNIPAAQLRAAYVVMQALWAGECRILARGHRFGNDGIAIEFHAHSECDHASGETPEAAVAALLARKGADHDH